MRPNRNAYSSLKIAYNATVVVVVVVIVVVVVVDINFLFSGTETMGGKSRRICCS